MPQQRPDPKIAQITLSGAKSHMFSPVMLKGKLKDTISLAA